MLDTEKVKDFMLALVKAPELQPANGKTFCNIGSRRVAELFGCAQFGADDLADEMISLMEAGLAYGPWTKTHFGEIAGKWARIGGLAFAAMDSKTLGEAHGHIAAVFPAPCELSPSLGHPVPFVANVGAKNGIMRVSEAFPVDKGEPEYFLWKL